MKKPNPLSILVLPFLLLGLLSTFSYAQSESPQQIKKPRYIPRVGQPGKDVIWVPTPEKLVEKMLWAAQVTPQDLVIDLGSGDGRMVIAAARMGARSRGVEYNSDMVELARNNAEEAGVADKVEFIHGDIFEYDFSDATVVTMFLLPSINVKLRPKLLQMKPGTRIVSNSFAMGDWRPDYKATIQESDPTWKTALIWIVPAQIAGTWKMGESDLVIRQEYQKFFGTCRTPNKTTNIAEGSLYGDSVSFEINGDKYTGHLTSEGTLEGVVAFGEESREWVASRVFY